MKQNMKICCLDNENLHIKCTFKNNLSDLNNLPISLG